MIADKEKWISELMDSCEFNPDFGSLNLIKDAESKFDKYISLLEMIDGNEGPEIVRALINSIRASNDSGAYQATIHALSKFFKPGYAISFIDSIAKLTFKRPDLASDLLLLIADFKTEEHRLFVNEFNTQLKFTHSSSTSHVISFIKVEEKKSLLSDFSGVLANL